MRIEHDCWTDVGRRDDQEDAYLAAPEHGLFAVADGMGGYEGGEIASRLALSAVQDFFERLDDGLGLTDDAPTAIARMGVSLRMADRAVSRRARGRLKNMGTTIASAVFEGSQILLGHVGDSRVYRLREGEVDQLTRDHSLLAEMANAGVAARRHLSSIITQAIGAGPPAAPDLAVHPIVEGDRYLLCTDGLSDVLNDEAIGWGLSSTRGAAHALVEAAFHAGSTDNITAVVLTAHA